MRQHDDDVKNRRPNASKLKGQGNERPGRSTISFPKERATLLMSENVVEKYYRYSPARPRAPADIERLRGNGNGKSHQ